MSDQPPVLDPMIPFDNQCPACGGDVEDRRDHLRSGCPPPPPLVAALAGGDHVVIELDSRIAKLQAEIAAALHAGSRLKITIPRDRMSATVTVQESRWVGEGKVTWLTVEGPTAMTPAIYPPCVDVEPFRVAIANRILEQKAPPLDEAQMRAVMMGVIDVVNVQGLRREVEALGAGSGIVGVVRGVDG